MKFDTSDSQYTEHRFKQFPLIVFLIMVLCGVGVKASELDTIKSKGTIVAFSQGNDRPNEYLDERGSPVGYEIDICKYIARYIGVKLDFNLLGWEGLLPALAQGRADIACSGVTITKARMEAFDFSVPYSRTLMVALVPPNSTAQGPTDMKGRLVGGVIGADGEDIIREIGGFRAIRVYPGTFEEFNDFLAGRLDMLIIGDKQAAEFLRLRPGAGKIVGQPYSILYTGIPVRKGATALKSAIDQAIHAAREDGTIDSLAQKYFHIANFTKSFPPVDVMPAVK